MDQTREYAGRLLLQHEGLRLKPYEDPAGDGSLVIGIGRSLTHRGISREEAEMLLDNDIDEAIGYLTKKLGWERISEARRAALIDAYHALGPARLDGFRKMWGGVACGDWPIAARELLDSKWGRTFPARVAELSEILRTGAL